MICEIQDLQTDIPLGPVGTYDVPDTVPVQLPTPIDLKPVPHPPQKRKRRIISIKDKAEIIHRLEKGEGASILATEYNVGKSTICDIKKNSLKIIAFADILPQNDESTSKRKTMKTAFDLNLDTALYQWYVQARALGKTISGPILQQKARLLNGDLSGDPNFKASNGWLDNFKARHGIRNLHEPPRDKIDVTSSPGYKYSREFLALVTAHAYHREMVYNCDETGLNWKSFPESNLTIKLEKYSPEKFAKEHRLHRMTVLVTSNAAGTFRLPLLCIGKSKDKSLKATELDLPVEYINRKNGWMDAAIFEEWFFKTFVPTVRERHEELKLESKAILLMRYSSVHPNNEILKTDDGQIMAVFIPGALAPILQPMDQGIITEFNNHYRSLLLQTVVAIYEEKKDSSDVLEFWKQFDIENALFIAANAWESVSKSCIGDAWLKLWPHESSVLEPDHSKMEQSIDQFVNLINAFSGNGTRNGGSLSGNVDKWLQKEQLNPNKLLNYNNTNELSEDAIIDPAPTALEAKAGLEIALKWMEAQPEINSTQIQIFKGIIEIADKKSGSASSHASSYLINE